MIQYNINKKRKILILFDDMMIPDILSNKKLNPIVTELFIRGKKIKYSLVFITQSYFAVRKNFRISSTHYFIIKIPKRRELQHIAFNHLSDIDLQDFMNYETTKPYSFLAIDTTLESDNSLRFRKNLLEKISKLILTIYDKIKYGKLQYNLNRKAAKILVLTSGKIYKFINL